MQRIRRHLTFSNGVALLALFIALGGVTYAAAKLPAHSVGAKQLKKNAVRSSKVKNHTLLRRDFKSGTLLVGPKGDKGDKGDQGNPGTPGANGTFGAVTVRSFTSAADVPDGTKTQINAVCPAGQTAIGGGGRGDDTNSEETNVTSSRPIVDAGGGVPADGSGFTGWRLTVTNVTGGMTTGIRPTVWVICATPAP